MSRFKSPYDAYLFDFTLGERPLTAVQERLSDQMMRYWGAFARSGNPNHQGAAAWPTYGSGQKVMQLRSGGASQVITSLAAEHNCALWLS